MAWTTTRITALRAVGVDDDFLTQVEKDLKGVYQMIGIPPGLAKKKFGRLLNYRAEGWLEYE